MADRLTIEIIKNNIDNRDWLKNNIFSVIQELSFLLLSEKDKESKNLFLQLLEFREDFNQEINGIIDTIIRELGLFPYIEFPNELSVKSKIAYEYHKPLKLWTDDIVFHRGQAEVYRALVNGKNVVLSAPTSFGKSLLIDSYISALEPDNVLIIVPTLALIDETRVRLSKNFGEKYKIITQSLQELSEKNIFVLTQERALERDDINKLDFLVIDEFYKLSPNREDGDDRSGMLNAALRKYTKITKQFYMLGPNIDTIAEGFSEEFKCEFIRKLDNTVATITHDLGDVENKLVKLNDLVENIHGSTIIYCQSPRSANEVAYFLTQNNLSLQQNGDIDMARLQAYHWISENYHPEWSFVKALEQGVGIHHASIPRALAQSVVHLFNQGHLPILVCTSTLIEGVNTVARNVIVYDHKIGKNKNIDFFTFNNIVGRSGRMFQHFVGNVYLFKSPPRPSNITVDIPAYSQGESATDSLLVQLDEEDLKPNSLERVRPYQEQKFLSFFTIRANKFIPPEYQIELAKNIKQNPEYFYRALVWNGFPKYQQLLSFCELIKKYFHLQMDSSAKTINQLTYNLSKVSEMRNIGNYLYEQENDEYGTIDKKIEEILSFIRNWATYKFPRYARAVELIQKEVYTGMSLPFGDYSAYLNRIENLYLKSGLISLDEYGIPIPLVIKMEKYIDDYETFDEMLSNIASLKLPQSEFSQYELNLISRVQKTLQ